MAITLFIIVAAVRVSHGVTPLTAAFPRQPASVVLAALSESASRDELSGASLFDAYGSGEWLQDFEREVSAELGMEAARFVPTGVCAQNMALCVYAGLPRLRTDAPDRPSFMCHRTSHLLLWEEMAAKQLLGMVPIVAGTGERPLLATDVEKELRKLRAVGSAPAVVIIEVPHRELGCEVTPWEELVQLRAVCDKYEVPLHMDGARLLEIAPYYGKAPAEICALFDSVYISFYKGLGAITGAMLLGPADFIKHATPWQRRMGGNPYTVMPYALSAREAYRAHKDSFAARWAKLREVAAALAVAAEARGAACRFVPAEPTCCQALFFLGGASSEELDRARDAVELATGVRLYQRLRSKGDEWFFEWTLGPAQLETPTEVFTEAWAHFFDELA